MKDLEDIKINSYLALISNPKTKKLMDDALKAPIGSSKRKAASTFIDTFKKSYTNSVFKERPDLKEQYILRQRQAIQEQDGKGGPMESQNYMSGSNNTNLSAGPRRTISTQDINKNNTAPLVIPLNSSNNGPDTVKTPYTPGVFETERLKNIQSQSLVKPFDVKVKGSDILSSVGTVFSSLFKSPISTGLDSVTSSQLPQVQKTDWDIAHQNKLMAPLLPGLTLKDGRVVSQENIDASKGDTSSKTQGPTSGPTTTTPTFTWGDVNMRTTRHNNPAAIMYEGFDTMFQRIGYKPGVDFIIGDAFPADEGGNQYHTMKFKDQETGIKATIDLIDKYGFYTDSGKQRWTHTAMSPENWNALTYEQKKSVVQSMHEKENGTYSGGTSTDATKTQGVIYDATGNPTNYTFQNPYLLEQYNRLSDDQKKIYGSIYQAVDSGMGETTAASILGKSKELLKSYFPEASDEIIEALSAGPLFTSEWGTMVPTLKMKKELEAMEGELQNFQTTYGDDGSLLKQNLSDYAYNKDTYLKNIDKLRSNTVKNLASNPLYYNSALVKNTTDQYLTFLDTLEARQNKRYVDVIDRSMTYFQNNFNNKLNLYKQKQQAATNILSQVNVKKSEMQAMLKEQYNILANLEKTLIDKEKTSAELKALQGLTNINLDDSQKKVVRSAIKEVLNYPNPTSKDFDTEVLGLKTDIVGMINQILTIAPNLAKEPELLTSELESMLDSIYSARTDYLDNKEFDTKVKGWINQLISTGDASYISIASSLKNKYMDMYNNYYNNTINSITPKDEATGKKQSEKIINVLQNKKLKTQIDDALARNKISNYQYNIVVDDLKKNSSKVKDLISYLKNLGATESVINKVITGLVHAIYTARVKSETNTDISSVTGEKQIDYLLSKDADLLTFLGIPVGSDYKTTLNALSNYAKEGIMFEKFGEKI